MCSGWFCVPGCEMGSAKKSLRDVAEVFYAEAQESRIDRCVV